MGDKKVNLGTDVPATVPLEKVMTITK